MRKVLLNAWALAILVVLTAPTSVLRVAADTAGANDLLALQNQLRLAVGSPAVGADPRVVAAAQHHADYSSQNGTGGHFEAAGLAGFTGESPRERVAAAGLVTAFVSEVATGGSSALAAVRQLWDAPYHRLGLMHPNAVTTGWGSASANGRSTTVGDLTYDFGARRLRHPPSTGHRWHGLARGQGRLPDDRGALTA